MDTGKVVIDHNAVARKNRIAVGKSFPYVKLFCSNSIVVQVFQYPAFLRSLSIPEWDGLTVAVRLSGETSGHYRFSNKKSLAASIRKGEMVVIPPGYSLSTSWGDLCASNIKPQPLVDVVVQVERFYLEKILIDKSGGELGVGNIAPEVAIEDDFVYSLICLLIDELESEHLRCEVYLEGVVNVLVTHLLCPDKCAMDLLRVNQHGGLTDSEFLDIDRYIDDHMDDKLMLSDLALRLGLSEYHFARKFKQTVAVSPYQYILEKRIGESMRLLSAGELSMSQVSMKVGFLTVQNFSSRFKKIVGMTPSQFRDIFL